MNFICISTFQTLHFSGLVNKVYKVTKLGFISIRFYKFCFNFVDRKTKDFLIFLLQIK